LISRAGVQAALGAAVLVCVGTAQAGQVWVEVGDGRMRSDLELLADAGVIDLPITEWPLPVADVDRVVARLDPARLESPALREALVRIQLAIEPTRKNHFHPVSYGVAAGQPGLLRDFDTPAREKGDVSVYMGAYGNRWAAELNLAYAFDPRDGQPVRLDGSNITARFGNWLFSFNTLDKWWGPSYATSLILSNNARPMPALQLENATSTPINFPVLRWLGPWRFNMYFALPEGNRPDVDDGLFFGNRFTFRPLHFLEIGLSRAAQFCGNGHPCNLKVLRNVLVGNYTSEYSGADKPGHAQGGYEGRLNSPWRAVPLAVYYQAIGNDQINHLPARLMKQIGAESWLTLGNGDVVRGTFDYTDSTCEAGRDPPMFYNQTQPCAYQNAFYFAGYRYRGLNIAATADAASILRTAAVRWVRTNGEEWQLKVQSGHFNRGSIPLPYDLVSGSGNSLYDSVQVQYRRPLLKGDLIVQLGGERQRPPLAIADGRAFGYISWRKGL
jgi:hypothetical protein